MTIKHSFEWELCVGGCGADDEAVEFLVEFEAEIEPFIPQTRELPEDGGYADLTGAGVVCRPKDGREFVTPASWLLDVVNQHELDIVAEHLYDDWASDNLIGG